MNETKRFCAHSDGLGYCDILSDDKTRQYCVEGPCPNEKIVEYALVVHGRWEHDSVGFDDFWRCSVCREDWFFDCDPEVESTRVNYCPNCGALMDGKSCVPRGDGES